MLAIRAGYQRLYHAIGCSLLGRQELILSFALTSDLKVSVYFGSKPRFGIADQQHSRYIVPGESVCWKFKYHQDVTQLGYSGQLFLEIFIYKDFEVPTDLFHNFNAGNKEAEGVILRFLDNENTAFTSAMDLVAGIIGLRFHRQFVIELMNENLVALRSNGSIFITITSPVSELVETVPFKTSGKESLELLGSVKLGEDSEEDRKFAANVLKWLLRAWAEHDPTVKFIALFIPLEIILNHYAAGPQIELRQMAKKVRRLIYNHGGEERKALLEFFNRLVERQKPSIVSRFEVLAQEANMPGYEQDIEAFKQFNKLRTRLLHEGEEKVPLAVSVTPEELCYFEDLVERYVNYVLFRDHLVYPSCRRLRGLQGGGIRNGE